MPAPTLDELTARAIEAGVPTQDLARCLMWARDAAKAGHIALSTASEVAPLDLVMLTRVFALSALHWAAEGGLGEEWVEMAFSQAAKKKAN